MVNLSRLGSVTILILFCLAGGSLAQADRKDELSKQNMLSLEPPLFPDFTETWEIKDIALRTNHPMQGLNTFQLKLESKPSLQNTRTARQRPVKSTNTIEIELDWDYVEAILSRKKLKAPKDLVGKTIKGPKAQAQNSKDSLGWILRGVAVNRGLDDLTKEETYTRAISSFKQKQCPTYFGAVPFLVQRVFGELVSDSEAFKKFQGLAESEGLSIERAQIQDQRANDSQPFVISNRGGEKIVVMLNPKEERRNICRLHNQESNNTSLDGKYPSPVGTNEDLEHFPIKSFGNTEVP